MRSTKQKLRATVLGVVVELLELTTLCVRNVGKTQKVLKNNMASYKITINIEDDHEQEIAREYIVSRDKVFIKDWSEEIISIVSNLELE